MAFTYAHVLRAEDHSSGELAALISTHLEPPSLEGINPKSVSEAQMKAGINVLIPGSAYLKPGDELRLLWGSRTYPIRTLDEEHINDPIIAKEWVSYRTEGVVPQGKVEVCYDINRDGQRIGTSAILHLNVHSCYRSSEKQRNRGRAIRRKQQRRPPPH
jgi:predicted ribonuclease toxin of YeeF-YezG toxin-antitoxin module